MWVTEGKLFYNICKHIQILKLTKNVSSLNVKHIDLYQKQNLFF